jgi:predicted RNA-binding Zn-ribbon protein involved in translation (DUF1610 family)
MKKIDIKEFGINSDLDAINFVNKLKKLTKSVYYFTDGEERFFVGEFEEDIPTLQSIVNAKIAILDEKILELEKQIKELQAEISRKIEVPTLPEAKPIETPSITFPPLPDLPKEEPPKLGFKSRLEEPTQTISPTIPMQTVTFKCPSCNNVFSENVPKDKKIIEVHCPQCGFTVYKKKGFWTRKRKIAVAGLAVLAFIIWLFLP